MHTASMRWILALLLVVYTWQLLWLIYGITTVFRKSSSGFLYIEPGHMPPSVYWCFTGTNVCAVISVLLETYDQTAVASTVSAMVFLYVSLCVSLRRVYLRAPVLIRDNKGTEVWLARGFVHNGLAAYATWITYVALFNFARTLTEVFNLDQELSITISVSTLFLETTAWFFMDNLTLDKYTRYMVTPYAINILTLISLVTHSTFSDFSSSNSISHLCW